MESLRELFPDIPKEQLDDALQSSAGDVELAIAQLLSIDRHPEANLAAVMANSVSPKSEDKLDDGDEKLAALATMFPDVDPDVLISRLISSNWQLSESIDAVLAQLAAEDELSIDNSRTNGRRRTQRSARRQIIHHFSAMAAITHRPQPAVSSSAGMNGGAVLDLSVGSPSLSVRTSSSVPTAPTQSSEQLRAQAQQLHQERSELYQKASEAYRRSSSTIQRQVASYYAQEAYNISQSMHRVNMEAAFQTVHENSQNHKQSEDTTVVVDLHHLRVHEAETVLDHEMERWQSQLKRDQGERCGNGRRPLMHIITGMGNRSAGRSPRLQPAVCQYLIRHGWAFETGPGYFLVRPK